MIYFDIEMHFTQVKWCNWLMSSELLDTVIQEVIRLFVILQNKTKSRESSNKLDHFRQWNIETKSRNQLFKGFVTRSTHAHSLTHIRCITPNLEQKDFDNTFWNTCCSVIRGCRVMNKASLDRILITLYHKINFTTM